MDITAKIAAVGRWIVRDRWRAWIDRRSVVASARRRHQIARFNSVRLHVQGHARDDGNTPVADQLGMKCIRVRVEPLQIGGVDFADEGDFGQVTLGDAQLENIRVLDRLSRCRADRLGFERLAGIGNDALATRVQCLLQGRIVPVREALAGRVQ